MLILGVDYGTSKVGLALGDTETRVATPMYSIKTEALALEIERIIEREGVELVVMGLPLSLNGQETASAKTVRQASAKLAEEISLPIVFEDERLTTAQAKRAGKASPAKRGALSGDDAVAAMYIAQSYLDKHYA